MVKGMKFITVAKVSYNLAIHPNRTETRGISSPAGSFTVVISEKRADFAAVQPCHCP